MKIRRRKKTKSGFRPGGIDLDSFLNQPKQPRQSKKRTEIDLYYAEAETRSESGDWDGATSKTFVGLYALCHFIVYGIRPEDLKEKSTFIVATKNAHKCLFDSFSRDPYEMVDYVKWVWEREKSREQWAKQRGISRKRLTTYDCFGSRIVMDYKVDSHRGRRVQR